MNRLQELMWKISAIPGRSGPVLSRVEENALYFIETVTHATADEILAALHTVEGEEPYALPVWARNLAYRMAVLQRPDDVELLREAAIDLYFHGPDWDHYAEAMAQRAGFSLKDDQ